MIRPPLPRFLRNDFVRTLAIYLSIPVVMIAGVGLAASINPEVGVRGLHYLWMFWLLTSLRHALFLGSELAVLGLWYLTCLSLVWAKGRSWAWSALAVAGPFGLIGLTMLGRRTVGAADHYDRWVGRMNGIVRAAYEIVLFAAICVAADQTVVLKRPFVIAWQSYLTGFSREEIIRQQEASSGMWAFGEGMEMLYLLVLLYLLWPICFNTIGGLHRFRAAAERH